MDKASKEGTKTRPFVAVKGGGNRDHTVFTVASLEKLEVQLQSGTREALVCLKTLSSPFLLLSVSKSRRLGVGFFFFPRSYFFEGFSARFLARIEAHLTGPDV